MMDLSFHTGDESAAARSLKLCPKLKTQVGLCRQKDPSHKSASAEQSSSQARHWSPSDHC